MGSSTEARIEITAGTSRLPAALRAAGKMLQGFVTGSTGMMKQLSDAQAAKPDRRSLAGGAFLGTLGANLAMRGIDVMVDQVKEVFTFEKALTRFGIAANKTPQQMRAIGDAARETSNLTGQSALEVLAAGRAYTDLAGASAFTVAKMNTLARAAVASGAATTDLAGMMYQLTRSMKVPDNELEDTMGGLINQAKEGGIEAAQMSAEFAGLLPLYARFGVTGREGAVEAGAMFQVVRDGFNSASEAGTGLQRVFAGMQTYASRFEAEGIQVYSKKRDALGRKVLLPVMEAFKNLLKSEAIKDPGRLKKMYGRTEGWRGVMLLDEALRTSGKLEDGLAGVLTRMEQLQAAGRVNGVIAQDAGTFAESSAGRMEIAVERAKNAFAEMLTPERVDQIVAGIEKIGEAIVPVSKALGWVADKLTGAYHAISGVKGKIFGTSDAHVQLTDDEKKLVGLAHMTAQQPGKAIVRDKRGREYRAATPEQMKAAAAIESNKKEWDTAADSIMRHVPGSGPVTDEAIKAAIRAVRSGQLPGELHNFTPMEQLPTSGVTPTEEAGAVYLQGQNIKPERYQKLDAEVVAETAARRAAVEALLGFTARVYDFAPPASAASFNSMSPEQLGEQLRRALQPVVDGLGKLKPLTAAPVGENPRRTSR